MVKHLASNDLVIKKLACLYLEKCANQKNEDLLLALNTLLKDCADPNPTIRGLALKTLCSLRDAELMQYSLKPLKLALQDQSAYVRRIAVMSCARIYKSLPLVIDDLGLVDLLYGMLRDSDPIVVVNCLHALNEILHSEGGVVVNRKIAYHLLNKLEELTEWGVATVMDVLTNYKPKSENEVFEIMNILDKFLGHSNSAVVEATFKVFLHLSKDLPHIKTEIFKRIKPSLVSFLNAGNPEVCFMILTFIDENILPESGDLFADDIKSFFCKQKEPVYLKVKKLKIIPMIASEDKVKNALDELMMLSKDHSIEVAQNAIFAIGKIAVKHNCHLGTCISRLVSLFHLNVDYISSSVLQVLKSLDIDQLGELEKIFHGLEQCAEVIQDPEGLCAMFWLLGEYGEHIDDAPYMLEDYSEKLGELCDTGVKLHLLSACVKLFAKRPAECQDTLGKLLEFLMIEEKDCDVQERARFYFHLLQKDVEYTKRLVLSR
ncbi:AP-4 complex subunit beta-1 isoform X2 [Lingula anatina]|nr:AP-4 complex subunit beta-1 isoform X2 [Lingula anatina]|eukprot:XP_013385832.1 AP-4 complex subunit beta-1 isoform X2 [Lingula anatina]